MNEAPRSNSACVVRCAGASGKSMNSIATRSTPVESAAQDGRGKPAVTSHVCPRGLQRASMPSRLRYASMAARWMAASPPKTCSSAMGSPELRLLGEHAVERGRQSIQVCGRAMRAAPACTWRSTAVMR